MLSIAFVTVVQSDWFRDQVRQRIVEQVEKATGGKVEIARFDYDWHTVAADLNGFVLHGKEAPAADPLLRVERIHVAIRVISILERSADISSIVLTRPQVNLIVAPDGSTNLPTPPVARRSKDPIAQLFALKLKHFAIVNGLAVVADKRIPLNVRGEGVAMTASYVRAGPSYEADVIVAPSRSWAWRNDARATAAQHPSCRSTRIASSPSKWN